MELIYAALLLHKSGNEINEENLKKVMDAAGAKADDTKIKAHLLGSGAILNEAVKAGQILESNYNVAADVWSVKLDIPAGQYAAVYNGTVELTFANTA